MKKILTIVLMISLCLMSGCAKQKEEISVPDPDDPTLDMSSSGVIFHLPQSMIDAKGVITPAYGTWMEEDKGICLTGLVYCALDSDTFYELNQKQELSQEEEKLLKDHILDMAHVYAIDQRRNAADLENILADKGIDFARTYMIGQASDYSFFLVIDPYGNSEKELDIDESFKTEYKELLKEFEHPSWIETVKPTK